MDANQRDPQWAEFVWADPDRLGGEVCFRDTRVPVRVLFEYVEGGYTLDQFLDDFEGVTREQVTAVLKLAARSVDPGVKAA